MTGRVNFFGKGMLTVSCYLLLAVFLVLANTGCDLWDDDDDDSASTGGAVVTTTPATPEEPATPADSSTPSVTVLSGTGFVWKPVSESDHNLVVLLPSSYGSGTGVAVLSPDGNLIENGRFVGRTNGDRPTYRFSRPGGGYPNGSLLRIGTRNYVVPSTASRYD